MDYPTCCFGLKRKSSRGVSVIVAECTIVSLSLFIINSDFVLSV